MKESKQVKQQVKLSDYAAFAFLWIVEAEQVINQKGSVKGYNGVDYNDIDTLKEDAANQIKVLVERGSFTDNDISVEEACSIVKGETTIFDTKKSS